MGHDLDDFEGQRSISLMDSPAQIKNMVPDTDKNFDSVPFLRPGSSVTVIGPDGNEMVVTVVKANEQDSNEQPVHVIPGPTDDVHFTVSSGELQTGVQGSQLVGTIGGSGGLVTASQSCSVDTSSSSNMENPLARLSQYKIDPKYTGTPSSQPILMPGKKIKQQNFLTLKQKYDLCKFHAENPSWNLDDVINHFEPLLGRRLPKSTVSTVFNKSYHYLALDPDSPSTWTRKKMGCSDSELFEDKLYKWVWQEIQSGGALTTRAVGDKAIQLANESGYSEFIYSPMWVQVFLKRFKLTDKINLDN